MQSLARPRPAPRGVEAENDQDRPVVSVVVPVYNVAPYLRKCLDSVVGQTIGLDRLELIAVDDGSTDGSAEILDEYDREHSQVRVFHQPNSGGPGRPRNIGLDHARGDFVFLMDADDYFGPEALERMVAMAERNGSDVVYGKMVGVGGRRTSARTFLRSRNRARLVDVYDTLNVMKLFRRSLIEKVGVRFDETVAGGEDSPFTAELLLAAGTISVVGDYDCYFYRRRPGSQTGRVRTEHPADYLLRMSRRAELLARHRPAGRERDRLMARHIRDLLRPFNRRWLALPPVERRRVFDLGARLLGTWNNEQIQSRLAPPHALRAYCLQHGLVDALEDIVAAPRWGRGPAVVDGGRTYLDLPHFRDKHGIPDRYFEVTGRSTAHRRVDRLQVVGDRMTLAGAAYIPHVGGEISVVLRRWPFGVSRHYPTQNRPTPSLRDRHRRYPRAGFTVDIELGADRRGGPLPAGPWQVRLAVGPPTLRQELSLKPPRRKVSTLPRLPDRGKNSDRRPSIYRAADGSLRLWMPGRARLRSALEPAAGAASRVLGSRRARRARMLRLLRRSRRLLQR